MSQIKNRFPDYFELTNQLTSGNTSNRVIGDNENFSMFDSLHRRQDL